ncbi:MAG: SRPBCC family protein [Gemmatimonadota bacterium]
MSQTEAQGTGDSDATTSMEAPATGAAGSSEARVLVKEVVIHAPADAVWRALSDAEELRRWFPADARVEPGVGGKVWVSWGPGMEWEQGIDIWEPGRHLRVSSPMPGASVPFATDYYIDVRGDTTVLRLVNSGFGEGADWDDMYFGMDGGWSYFLFNLRHYLERHPGKPRSLAFERRRIGLPRSEFFPDALRALGRGDSSTPLPGAAVTIPLGDRRYDGRVALALKDHLAVVVPALDDALLFLELEPGAAPHLGVYLSTYGTGPDRAEDLRKRLGAFADVLVPPGV